MIASRKDANTAARGSLRQIMKVVILCGGLGTRMRDQTEFRPKPMVEIGGRPILWHIMRLYAHHDFREFVLCLGYKGTMIKEYFLKYEAMNSDFTVQLGRQREIHYHGDSREPDLSVTLLDTGQETMTGGRVLRTKPHVTDDTFMVTYGDGVSDLDVRALEEFHRAHGKLATVTTVKASSQFGILDIANTGQVSSFAEKPQIDGWISAGFLVLDRRVFDYLDGDACVLEREPMERLVREGQLVAYQHDGFFYSMDTYREYVHLNRLWASGEAPWKVWK
jgi:glucose-1-phosphate cytidylyltransferase